jgi:D-aminopeptidase
VLGDQCRRLAQRASIGLGRAGGGTSDSSGDIFLAFSTGNTGTPPEYFRPGSASAPIELRALPHEHLSALFGAVAEATEEAILNALLSAGDMTGRDGITAHGLTPQALGQAFRLAADDLRSTAARLSQRGQTGQARPQDQAD